MIEEILSLSDDIIGVRKLLRTSYAFVEFVSEEKAEENYAAFQNLELCGNPITLDYMGVKNKNPLKRNFLSESVLNVKRLFVSSLPLNVKINQIAKLTPNATSIVFIFSRSDSVAYVGFDSKEEATEAFEANEEVKINGKPVTFVYAEIKTEKERTNKAFKRNGGGGMPFYKDRQQPFTKRPRQDLDPLSQDYAAYWKNFSA